jgi:hypothetical protein
MSEQVLAFLRGNGVFLAVLVGIVAAFVLLRTKATDLDSVDEFDGLLGAGQPVVVEFYSNT